VTLAQALKYAILEGQTPCTTKCTNCGAPALVIMNISPEEVATGDPTKDFRMECEHCDQYCVHAFEPIRHIEW
jgi:hypothetical protein